ncbi:WD40 repeat domain-containing protein [Nannocystis sp. SCPEA4]|uniref:WD40 repeat domain-containing protein n=1 Tax=Nannocystis sp. SCPEA4 TaxID=2996787 RepID=UPI00226FA683|nr:WD40 repeat domain-containing protein [Nannocystis sp. SCPEA4]MCY1060368.1 WD40 repeat domain-containing protein [Nannocystis sp. SCPEA4]
MRRSPQLSGLVLSAGLVACRPGPAAEHAPVITATPPVTGPSPASRRQCSGPSRAELLQLPDHVRHLDLAPDGRWSAVAGARAVSIVDVAGGEPVLDLPGSNAAFLPAGATLVVARAHSLVSFALPDLSPGTTYLAPAPFARPPALAIAPGGARIAAYSPAELHVWDVASGRRLCDADRGLRFAAFAPTSPRAYACDGDALVEWDPATCSVLRSWPMSSPCTTLAISDDGSRVLVAGHPPLILDTALGTWVPHHLRLAVHGAQVRAGGEVLVAGNGLHLVDIVAGVASRLGDEYLPLQSVRAAGGDIAAVLRYDATVAAPDAELIPQLWSLTSLRPLRSLPATTPPRYLRPVELAAHGESFVATTAAGHAVLYRVATGEPLVATDVGRRQVALAGDGSRFLVHRSTGELALHDARSGALLNTVTGLAFPYPLAEIRLVVDGPGAHAFIADPHGQHTLLALADGTRTSLRDGLAWRGPIEAVFSPDGARLLTHAAGARPIVWDVARGKPLRHLEVVPSALGPRPFSADGRRLLLRDDDGVAHVFDVASGRRVRSVRGWHRHALAADGAHLLVSGREGRVSVLSVATGKPVWELPVEGAVELRADRGAAEIDTDRERLVFSLASGAAIARRDLLLVADDHALTVRKPDGTALASSALTEDGRRVAWTGDGAWDGDVELLRFSAALVPCSGGSHRPGLWRDALVGAMPAKP